MKTRKIGNEENKRNVKLWKRVNIKTRGNRKNWNYEKGKWEKDENRKRVNIKIRWKKESGNRE